MKKIKKIVHSEWLIGALLTIIILGAYLLGWSPLSSIENKTYDLRARMLKSDPQSPIVIVAIDDNSIQQIGRWPWDRSTIAGAINMLTEYEASVIGMNIFYSEPKIDPGQDYIKDIIYGIEEQNGFERNKALAKVYEDLKDALEMLDNDAALEEAISQSGRVVLPLNFLLGERLESSEDFFPQYLIDNSVASPAEPEALTATEMMAPFEDFAAVSAGFGHVSMKPDSDGTWRKTPLIMEFAGRYFPSFELELAMKHLQYTPDKLDTSGGIGFGSIKIKTTDKKEMYIKYRGNSNTFSYYSFIDVLQQLNTPAELFKNKIVLIGLTASGLSNFAVTPMGKNMPNVEVQANVIDDILTNQYISRPLWAGKAELGALLLMGLVISLLIPRLKALYSALVTIALLAAWVGGCIYLFVSQGYWLMIVPHTLLITLGYTAVVSSRFMLTEKRSEKFESDNIETNKMLGLSFQSQGMLDLALDKFMKCPIEEEDIKEHMYNLALDFERKRQFNKAASIYEHIGVAGSYRDIDDKIDKLKRAGDTMIFGGSLGGKKDATMIVEGVDMAPTLGRYEVKKELGKGAMGIVYLGQDPKINRQVAIKTIRFDEVDEAMIKDVKERFFREAEAAGRLSHPNIVTIFDAGEEHELAYVAMELLDGKDLSDIIQEKGKLPPQMAIQVAGQVADALNYAHKQGIVHRDIKPANIMLLKKGGIKVTDFGIARVVESSKTQTGVVLGTPSYMSPEQVAGKKVDGRSDLFSLGVMFYELLSGKKPFTGDSLATLMYNIANNPHTPLTNAAPGISDCCAVIVDRFLAKDLNKRYQTGAQAIKDLKACYQALLGKGA